MVHPDILWRLITNVVLYSVVSHALEEEICLLERAESCSSDLDSSEYFSEKSLIPFFNFVPSNKDIPKWDIQDGKMAMKVFNNGKVNFGWLFQGLVFCSFNQERESWCFWNHALVLLPSKRPWLLLSWSQFLGFFLS